MEPLRHHHGIVAPLSRANIDTDQIIPKQFLKRVERTGFGEFLFWDWRTLPDQSPNPDFLLNRAPYNRASILVTGPNFGCGSSREHAPWALHNFGFRVIIAASFADIFYNNCFQNGLLPLTLPAGTVENLLERAVKDPGFTLDVDVEGLTLATPDKSFQHTFVLEAYRQETLLLGLDDIGRTLALDSHIEAFESSKSSGNRG